MKIPDLSRRSMLAGGASLAFCYAGPSFAAARGGVAFQVWRSGRQIGRHAVTFKTSGGDVSAAIEADFVVHIGPVPVFRYHHAATEVWRDGAFSSLESQTVSNGKHEQVSALASPGGVRITDGGGRVTNLAAGASPLTHWNRAALKRPLFNPQTGAAIRAAVAQKAGESVALADGRSVPATRFTLTGGVQIVDWYDVDDAWTCLRARAEDGSYVDYKRVA